jgi:hypothetical protein
MIIPNIWKNNFMFQTTNQVCMMYDVWYVKNAAPKVTIKHWNRSFKDVGILQFFRKPLSCHGDESGLGRMKQALVG